MVGDSLHSERPRKEYVMDDNRATESTDGRPTPITFIDNELTIKDRFAVIRRDRVRFGDNVEGTHWRITSGNGHPGVVILP